MASLTDLLTAMQQGVTGLNNLTNTFKSFFPQATTSSTVAPSSVGAITFTSSQPVGFLLVTLSSGTTVKFPYYNQ
jgi:hypothetical protein